ncbi:MAG: hypothetical protein M1834_006339 [Cirrosporium novae-zelandiae]|nr:MAG: hypothetical protein M1834_006339 [Cirrosporium novae-zelandiae]
MADPSSAKIVEKAMFADPPVTMAATSNLEKSVDQHLSPSFNVEESNELGTTDPEKLPHSTTLDDESLSNSQEREGSDNDANNSFKDKSIRPWYKRLLSNPLKWSPPPPVPEKRDVLSREYGASFFSQLTFHWMGPLMRTGYKRPLELNDVWLVNPNRSVEVLSPKVEASFKRRVARGDRYPLAFALYETFKFEFWLGGFGQLFASIVQVIAPFTLRYLISFAEEAYLAQRGYGKSPNIGRGFGLVIGITAMMLFMSIGINQFIYRGMQVGGQSRAVLINLIFGKSMRISGRAKAGGKAIDQGENLSHEKSAEADREKLNFIQRMLSKKFKPRTGPILTPDKAKGIVGDGTGWSNGKITNLMAVDTYRVDQAFGMFHMIWTAPIAVLLALVLLIINLTYSALAGFGFIVVLMPLLGSAIKSLFKRRRAINKVTDQRVSLTQEILQAVRFVKYFGWEKSFLERLQEIRKREIHAIQILLALRNGIIAVSISMPVFASMLAFITYSLSNHVLNPAPIFSSMALFNSLRLPLTLLPMVIGQVIDAWASLGRVQEFLLAEEAEDDVTWDFESNNAIKVVDADFTWEREATHDPTKPQLFKTKSQLKRSKKEEKEMKKAARKAKKTPQTSAELGGEDDSSSSTLTALEPFKLQDINLTVGRNELIAVIGGVGSGKTSLLAALAGDMRRTKGDLVLGASRAFCPQYAWIQNATFRENITFGKEYNETWYRRVIDACALGPDLEILPNGEFSEIGERGITLSGGQKQRLNIARAIYFDADIILMDDPLSAVDSHVGRHIFDKAICGLLKDKCRILATHQLHVLQRCDRIVWMQDNTVESIGTYDNLMRDSEEFRKLMATIGQEEKEESPSKNPEEVEEDKKEIKKQPSKPGAGLMQQEDRAVKSVPWSVYKAYVQASGTLFNGIVVFASLILSQCANIATSLWLSFWTSDKFNYPDGYYIAGYAGLGVLQSALMFVFSTTLSVYGTNASKTFLHQAMARVLRAPMSFFDTTPLGRITNRFSKDVDTMDNFLTDAIRMYLLTLAMITAVFILIIVYFHYFAIALVPLTILFIFAASYYRASAREIKRHEAVLRSSVFSKFSEGVSGISTIRAYGLQGRFVKTIRESIDTMDSAYFLTYSNQRWLSLRLDCIGNVLVFVTGILVVTSRFNVSPSISGLVLSYILSIVGMLQFTVRQLAEVENGMNSAERVYYYTSSLDEEAPLYLKDVRDSWPEHGEIAFNNVQMRYRAGLPLVLQNFTATVAGGERMGIVGRTGAGKSSIMSTLFRLVELSGGNITIDGINIATVGLHDLRTRMAIIPQDPTLFRGTIRTNLDPFNEHTDLELWSALRQADLVDQDAELNDKTIGRVHLDSIVEEEGLNFSLGQRQLMALARALVRNARIIICDEATSSVDMETDAKIQGTMARGFKGKTLLCIAHRLRTILNYDRICVMDRGQIAELDTPLNLFDRGGIFRSMCDRSGIVRDNFFEVEGFGEI